MKLFYLNNVPIPFGELKDFALLKISSPLPDWEKDIFQVILDWFDDKDFVLQKTSGSTGEPKEIKLRKTEMVESARMTSSHFDLPAGSTTLLCLPAHYIAGKMMIIRALVNEWKLWYVKPASDPLKGLKQRVDLCAMVPLQVHNSIQNNGVIFSNINKIIIGGAPIPPSTMDMIRGTSNACYATYGMTETITHIATKKLNGLDQQAYFMALPGVSFEIDERGCLVIHPPHIQGSIITNDLVSLRGNNSFQWLGRFDHIINSGGVKIIPEQVEIKIRSLSKRRMYIIGEADPTLGEKVILKLEGAPYSPDELSKLKKKMKDVLSKFEFPKEIQFVPKFAETSSGKVRRI